MPPNPSEVASVADLQSNRMNMSESLLINILKMGIKEHTDRLKRIVTTLLRRQNPNSGHGKAKITMCMEILRAFERGEVVKIEIYEPKKPKSIKPPNPAISKPFDEVNFLRGINKP